MHDRAVSLVYLLRINRNIVECKGVRTADSIQHTFVLIETLWNVKLHIGIYRIFQSTVLIETLWNVKPATLDATGKAIRRINRNIVECKAALQKCFCRPRPCINRNIVECKVIPP